MKRHLLSLIPLLFCIIVNYSCRKDNNPKLPPKATISINGSTGSDIEGNPVADTTIIPVDYEVRLGGFSVNGKFLWDFGDSTISESIIAIHKYSKSGIYKVTLKISNENGSSESSRFIKACGSKIISGTNELIGLFTYQTLDGYNYLIDSEGEGNTIDNGSLFLRKYQGNLELNKIKLNPYASYYFSKFKDVFVDKNENFLIFDDDIGKIDKAGNTVFKNSYEISPYSVYESLSNEYYVTGSDYGKFVLVQLKSNGAIVNKSILYSGDACQYAQFINDSTYFLLVSEKSNNDTLNLSIIKRELKNNIDSKKLSITDFASSKTKGISDGYLIYGFSLNYRCTGCFDYFNIAKINSNLDILWKKKISINEIDVTDEYYNRISIVESNNMYYCFYLNELIILDSTGNVAVRKRLLGIDNCFTTCATKLDGGNILVLMNIYVNPNENLNKKPYSLLLYLDKNGEIVN